MTDQPMERRCKLYRITEEDLMHFLRRWDAFPDGFIITEEITGPPDGSTIEDVHYDWSCRCFFAMVSHPDFDLVPDGMQCPRSDDPLNIKRVAFGRCRDGAYRVIDVSAVWASCLANDGPVCPTCKRPNDHFVAKEFSIAVSEYVKHLELSANSVLVARIPAELPPAVTRDNLYDDLCKLLVDSCKAIVVLPHDMDLSEMPLRELESLRDKLNEMIYDKQGH